MAEDNSNFKFILAIAIGAIGGLIIGNYLWGDPKKDRNFSKHFETLTQILKQIEGFKGDEAENLKGRITSILETIESKYGND